jgi:hypothetical protein
VVVGEGSFWLVWAKRKSEVMFLGNVVWNKENRSKQENFKLEYSDNLQHGKLIG